MKKIVLLLVLGALGTLPGNAALHIYRSANGPFVLEATDCNTAARLAGLARLPDEPPEGTEETDSLPAADHPAQEGLDLLSEAVFGPEKLLPSTNKHGISADTDKLLDETSFEERQDAFITFVRDVNWKTGMYVTFRDYSLFRRLKMACQGINQLKKPVHINLDGYTGSLDQSIQKVADAGIDALAKGVREHSFSAMSKLSVLGLAIAIEKDNPFLLLAIDEDTYHKLVEMEPKIETLFEDMYTFFHIRSIGMGDYSANIKDLIDITKLGKGDSFNTWHVMAEYAKKMLDLQRQNKLNPQDERDLHIWRLESSMSYIKEHVRIEARAAELAEKDPKNAGLVAEVKNGPKKKPSLEDKARELLQKSTQAEIKHLIQKYKGE